MRNKLLHFGRVCEWLEAGVLSTGVSGTRNIVEAYRIVLGLMLTDRWPGLTTYWQGLLRQHGLWREPEVLGLDPEQPKDSALYRQQDMGASGKDRRRVRISGGEISDPAAFKEMWRRQGMISGA